MATKIIPPEHITKTEETYDKGYDPKVARGLMRFVNPYLGQMLTSLVLMIFVTAAAVSGPYFVKLAIDDGISQNNIIALRNTVSAFFVVNVLQLLANFARLRIMARVGQNVLFDVRTAMFDHLQNLSLSFYNRYSVGRVITRVINDVGTLREFVTWAVLAIVRNSLMIIGTLIAMVSLNFRLSAITLTVVPIMVLATILYRNIARRNYRKMRAAISWTNSVLAENVNGVRVVQAFSRQAYNFKKFSGYVNQYQLETTLDAAKVASVFTPIVDVLGAIATALVVYIGGTAVLGESITPGVLIAFVLYIDRLFGPIRDLSRRFDTFQSTMAGGERILELLNTPVEVQDADDAKEMEAVSGDVRFEDVQFHYSDDPTLVLDGINLNADKGQTLALVGETGAGKTTIIKLLARFHDPTSGCVRMDGVDLQTVTQQSLRRQIGMVLQDPFLFTGTVKENILFGRLDANDEEVIAAAQAVGAHDFIMDLKNAYETKVEEGGVNLSVGQRQLLSFARALLADPRILILDEATSSVDTQTEQVIQKALATLLNGRTSFVIAHRLSTITNADKIVVIHNGKIIEQGTHAALLTNQGMYYELYKTGFQE
ncbi:MAG TPA: ABC transporter ATP-binding protein [Anaerolineales bacterium]|nr:ABC transporter ATP-binding protein [Anaerolineales bacterium]